MNLSRNFLAVSTALLAVLAATATHGKLWQLADHWNPFAPLGLKEPPGILTRFKLGRLTQDRRACLNTLATSSFRFESVPDRDTGQGCGFRNAVRIERTALAVGAAFTLSCPAAVSLALWELHTLQPAARRHFGESAARLEHFGSYACRNVYGHPDAQRSRHATANAIDVAGVQLESGRRIRVSAEWSASSDASAFLRDLRDGACRTFDGVLSPDYNAAHADHLHLDRGGWGTCR